MTSKTARDAFTWALALLFCTGCTTIHVHSDRGVAIHAAFGFTRIDVPRDTSVLATDVSGLGVVMGTGRVTVGWMSEQSVALRDASRCQAVFMAATLEDAAAIRRLLAASERPVEHICVISRGGSNAN